MRVLVCGSRSRSTKLDKFGVWNHLDTVHRDLSPIEVIIQGDCYGPDIFAKEWAIDRKIAHLDFPADWKTHDKSAGFKRNVQMLDEGKPTLVLAFWDGQSRGTKHTIDEAKKRGIEVQIVGQG